MVSCVVHLGEKSPQNTRGNKNIRDNFRNNIFAVRLALLLQGAGRGGIPAPLTVPGTQVNSVT